MQINLPKRCFDLLSWACRRTAWQHGWGGGKTEMTCSC